MDFYLISTVHTLEEWPQTAIYDCARNVELLNHNFCCESSIMSVPAAAAAILDNYGTLVDNWRNYILFMLSSVPTQCCSVTIIVIVGDYAGKIIFCPSTLILLCCRAIGLQGYSVVNNPEQYLLGGKGAPGSITSPLCNRSVVSTTAAACPVFMNVSKIIYTVLAQVCRYPLYFIYLKGEVSSSRWRPRYVPQSLDTAHTT